MHDSFYKLTAEPFRLSPDPRYCFQHRTYRKAMIYMRHALHRAEGFIMITGRPGTGKTTLIQDLLQTLKPGQAMIANLVTTQMTADDLLRLVAYSYNLDPEGVDKVDVLVRIDRFLKQQHQQGRRPLLIVDEAQDMAEDALEELRLLTNIQAGGQQILQIFLVGQEQLRDLVNAPSMEQLHQRMIAATHLEPLDCEDTEAYIKHRLRCVVWTGDPLLSKEAYAMIQHYSQGIPRQINQICSRLFLHGSLEEKHRLGTADVKVVIDELRQEFLIPVETADMPAQVPLSADQHQEIYEEEPRRETAPPAAPNSVPAPAASAPPTLTRRQETEAVPQRPTTEVPITPPPIPDTVAAANKPDQAGPGKRKTSKRGTLRQLLLTGLIIGLILTLVYSVNPELIRQSGQDLMSWVRSDKHQEISISPGESLADITAPDAGMVNGTVVREPPPLNHEPKTGALDSEVDAIGIDAAAEIETAPVTAVLDIESDTPEDDTITLAPDPDLQQAGLLQLEVDLLQSGLLVERTDDGILKVNLSSDVMYDFDSAKIKDGARPALKQLADVLKKYQALAIQVVGHTDSSGTAEYNLYLSQLRSKAVADYLVSQGLTDSSIESEGRGDLDTRLEQPASYNPGLKRRVEIYIRRAPQG